MANRIPAGMRRLLQSIGTATDTAPSPVAQHVDALDDAVRALYAAADDVDALRTTITRTQPVDEDALSATATTVRAAITAAQDATWRAWGSCPEAEAATSARNPLAQAQAGRLARGAVSANLASVEAHLRSAAATIYTRRVQYSPS